MDFSPETDAQRTDVYKHNKHDITVADSVQEGERYKLRSP